MYVEYWQIFMFLMVGTSAYFSYRQGQSAGVQAGVQIVISDLHEKGIIAIYKDHENGEVVVGRYDEDDFEVESIDCEEDEF
jgi:hypothetical protein